ncbi:hypothetical protein Dimus_019906 [Dionaea muscipula]
MAILNYYFSVNSSVKPISQDPNPLPSSSSPRPQPSSPNRLPTKIILPKKKPMKWSTGTMPAEYGGPLRTKWGPRPDDPITSPDFIWNKEFMGQFEKLVQQQPDPSSIQSPPAEEDSPGFLNLDRVMSLDSLEVDLSASLVGPPIAATEEQAKNTQLVERATQRWRPAPTRREQDRWKRATRAASGGSAVLLSESSQPQQDPKVLAAQSLVQYYKLKQKLQILTLGIGGVGLLSAYLSYTPEVAISFGAGLVGSLVYLRMLGNSVDSLGNGGMGIIRGAVGQPRLLIPFILVMIYNRWNV